MKGYKGSTVEPDRHLCWSTPRAEKVEAVTNMEAVRRLETEIRTNNANIRRAMERAITFRTEDNVHMCLSFEKMHMMEPRTERIKPHLDLAVGLWLLYSTLLKIQFSVA